SGGSTVTITNSNSQTSTVQSVAPGSATIKVAYTYNGASSSATQTIKVQLPAHLGITYDSGSLQNFSCGGAPFLCGVQRFIGYQVQEADGTPVTAAMPIFETFSPVSNTCSDLPSTPQPSSGTTDGNGNFPSTDHLAMRSLVCLPADSNGI